MNDIVVFGNVHTKGALMRRSHRVNDRACLSRRQIVKLLSATGCSYAVLGVETNSFAVPPASTTSSEAVEQFIELVGPLLKRTTPAHLTARLVADLNKSSGRPSRFGKMVVHDEPVHEAAGEGEGGAGGASGEGEADPNKNAGTGSNSGTDPNKESNKNSPEKTGAEGAGQDPNDTPGVGPAVEVTPKEEEKLGEVLEAASFVCEEAPIVEAALEAAGMTLKFEAATREVEEQAVKDYEHDAGEGGNGGGGGGGGGGHAAPVGGTDEGPKQPQTHSEGPANTGGNCQPDCK